MHMSILSLRYLILSDEILTITSNGMHEKTRKNSSNDKKINIFHNMISIISNYIISYPIKSPGNLKMVLPSLTSSLILQFLLSTIYQSFLPLHISNPPSFPLLIHKNDFLSPNY
mmetsp:Transcript_19563/g.35270  ORF Transcript_19563/g.35270 Transcript_19563/m.35270 type:complete len:114 (+) Transcript_19563:641-982(+)